MPLSALPYRGSLQHGELLRYRDIAHGIAIKILQASCKLLRRRGITDRVQLDSRVRLSTR